MNTLPPLSHMTVLLRHLSKVGYATERARIQQLLILGSVATTVLRDPWLPNKPRCHNVSRRILNLTIELEWELE